MKPKPKGAEDAHALRVLVEAGADGVRVSGDEVFRRASWIVDGLATVTHFAGGLYVLTATPAASSGA